VVKTAHPRKTKVLGLIGLGEMEMTVTLLSNGTAFTRLSLAQLSRPGLELVDAGVGFGFKAPASRNFE